MNQVICQLGQCQLGQCPKELCQGAMPQGAMPPGAMPTGPMPTGPMPPGGASGGPNNTVIESDWAFYALGGMMVWNIYRKYFAKQTKYPHGPTGGCPIDAKMQLDFENIN